MTAPGRLGRPVFFGFVGSVLACAPFSGGDVAPTQVTDAAAEAAADDASAELDVRAADGGKSSYVDEVLADDPVGYWRLGETAGNVVSARYGAPNGAISGGPTLDVAGLVSGPDRAIGFDGNDDRIDFGDAHGFAGTSSFSVEMWMQPGTPIAQWRRIISKETANQGGWSVQLISTSATGGSPPNAVSLQRADATGAGEAVPSDIGLQQGIRYHVVGTYDGVQMRIYVDGELRGTRSSTRQVVKHTSPLRFGMSSSWTDADRYSGTLDEVAIYRTALSAARVKAHYDAGR